MQTTTWRSFTEASCDILMCTGGERSFIPMNLHRAFDTLIATEVRLCGSVSVFHVPLRRTWFAPRFCSGFCSCKCCFANNIRLCFSARYHNDQSKLESTVISSGILDVMFDRALTLDSPVTPGRTTVGYKLRRH